jgi:hypothetical protein
MSQDAGSKRSGGPANEAGHLDRATYHSRRTDDKESPDADASPRDDATQGRPRRSVETGSRKVGRAAYSAASLTYWPLATGQACQSSVSAVTR